MSDHQIEDDVSLHAPEDRLGEPLDRGVSMPSSASPRRPEVALDWARMLRRVRDPRGLGQVSRGPAFWHQGVPNRALAPDVFDVVSPVLAESWPPRDLARDRTAPVVEGLSTRDRSPGLTRQADDDRNSRIPGISAADERDQVWRLHRRSGDDDEPVWGESGPGESSAEPIVWPIVAWLGEAPAPGPHRLVDSILAG